MKSLYVLGTYQLLSAIMVNRKETTQIEEYLFVIKEIFDPKDDMKLLHIIDRLCLSDFFWFTLGFS